VELRVKYQRFFERITVFFGTAIRFMLNALVVIISCALIIGVIKAGVDLFQSVHKPLEVILQSILLDIVFIVALVEVTITILAYLKDGAVHVRYIVDTILIIMLNEVVTIWFKGASLQEAIGLSVILATLAVVRITTVRWGPESDEGPGSTGSKSKVLKPD
jgi:uncharacterized membrane protein (DUF373 family)